VAEQATPSDGSNAAPATPPPSPVLEPLVALTRQRHPELDEAGTEAVRRLLAQTLQAQATMRAYPLLDADEPDLTFSAYRGD
jgi:hypothetical protein